MKNKRPLTPDQFKDLITYADGSHEPRSWKDYGFNDHMEKPARSEKIMHLTPGGKRWCDYDYKTRTLQILHNDGQLVALTFDLYNGKISDQTVLFEVGYELWHSNIMLVQRMEILKRCEEKTREYELKVDVTQYWLKNTLMNLRNKVNKSQVSGLIRVFERQKGDKHNFIFSISQMPDL